MAGNLSTVLLFAQKEFCPKKLVVGWLDGWLVGWSVNQSVG
jgi:hypothetical protein